MENRIRKLRKSKGMNQETLAAFVGVSQQTISKIERDINALGVDLLIQLANYFNVTTDYILGLSNQKRNTAIESKINKRVEEKFDLVIEYEELNPYNQKLLLEMIRTLREVQQKEASEQRKKKRNRKPY